jgi:hypothetical protein
VNANTTAAEPAATVIAATDGRRVVRAAVVWVPGLAVALGAAVATAHGLYEVALAARVPAGIAWLYPLITDGLALVAYAATTRLCGPAARYAWSVVVLAAGLSGLAQAALLGSGTTMDAPTVLRYGVGAWPAVAAAIVAHLLYLLAAHTTDALASKQVFIRHRPDRLVYSPPGPLFNQRLFSQPRPSPFNRFPRPVSSQPARVHRSQQRQTIREPGGRGRPRRGTGHRQRLRDMPTARAACPPSLNWPPQPTCLAAPPQPRSLPCASNRPLCT